MTLRALRIALDTGQSVVEELPAEVERLFGGGRGAALWLLATHVPPSVGPLSPSNLLIFSAGPLTGMLPVGTGGFLVTTRSPLTGTVAHSWGLGRLGAVMRRAGYDLLVVEGQRPEWCVICIDGPKISLLPAAHLVGLDTAATPAALRQNLGDDYVTACVGPAGEAGVAYSSIVAEGAFAAQPAGTGAVMAGKRIKALAVRGTARLVPADGARVDATLAVVTRRAAQSDTAAGLRQYGSLFYATAAADAGALTGRNGQDAQPAHLSQIGRVVLAQRGRREPRGCEGCPIPCHAAYIRKTGEPIAYPELEALAGFGARCGIANPDTLIILNDMCIRLGLDVVETSAALAFMAECRQEGLAGGTLTWGDSEALVAAVRRLGQRQEKRDILSLGVGEMQEVYWGSSAFAPQAKGMALPALDPRALPMLALAMAVSPIGGDHRYAMAYEELLAEPPAWFPDDAGNPQANRGAAARLIWYERFAAAIDAAGICRNLALLAFQIAPAEVTELINAALGRTFSGVEVARMGERIVTFERLLTRRYQDAPDALPPRWSQMPLDAAGKTPPLHELLAEYYRRHGWTEAGDVPPARVADLGLADV
jgi:aldehyde:ferredoxin oxidoreductase